MKDSKGNTRYFFQNWCHGNWLAHRSSGEALFPDYFFRFATNGIMAVGFKEINDVTYYFCSGSGAMATGWVENTDKGTKYYFDPTSEQCSQEFRPLMV